MTGIAFVHIPRTGGKTFRTIIHNNYSKDQYARVYKGREVYLNPAALADVPVIYGHFPYQSDRINITMLRHPAIRLNSLADHWRSKNLSIDNAMTRQLAAHGPIKPVTSNTVDAALANLKAMPAFGITEFYEESVERICAAMNWRPACERVREQSNPKIEHGRRDRFDEDLYYAALALFRGAK